MQQDTPLLFQMLQTLTDEELKEFLLYAQSPHWQGDKKRLALLDIFKNVSKSWKKGERNWKHASLLKPQLRKLYPGSASETNVERLLSETAEILRHYLIFKELEKQESARRLLLAEALVARRLDDEFKKSLRNFEKALSERPDRSAAWFLDCYRLEDLRRKYHAMHRQDEHNFAKVFAHFDCFVLLEKLKYACFLLHWRNVRETEVPPALMEELEFLTRLHRPAIEANPVLKIFFVACQLYTHDEAEFTANELRELLEKHAALLPEEELKELHWLAFNFLIYKVNTQALLLPDLNRALDDTMFSAKYLASLDYLREGNFIPHQRLKNIVSIALNTGKPDDLAWAKQFLKENIGKVQKADEQQDLKLFSNAAIHFYERKFRAAIHAINSNPAANNFYKYDLKSLALRIYFEERESQDFSSALSQARNALNGDTTLPDQHKKGYLSYFKFLEDLFSECNPGPPGRMALIKMKADIEATAPLPQRKWLLEKMGLLMPVQV